MDYKLLGKNIRKYRKQKGLGQEELAEMSAVPVVTSDISKTLAVFRVWK